MPSILEVVNLHKSYRDVKAVDGVSFALEEGSCFGLLGPNGAGKTTTVEMMEGILLPDRGEILYRSSPLDSSFRKRAGIQFQSTSLPDHLSVEETIRLFQSFYAAPRAMQEIVEICSLGDIIRRDNKKLSGGQRQRLLLAIALVPNPDVVFLDEPTTGLDPQARRNFWSLIRRIQSEGATVVLTTHYMDEAQQLCDTIAIMDHGKILEIDSPNALLHKHFDGAVVRVPMTETTFASVKKQLSQQTNYRSGVLEVSSERIDETIKQLLTAGLNLDGLVVHKPTLEDVFIKLTGASLRS